MMTMMMACLEARISAASGTAVAVTATELLAEEVVAAAVCLPQALATCFEVAACLA
jgi:hypothetical protein